MSTVIRAEVSKKNPYHINKHRYYELKHFCLQYPEWKLKVKERLGMCSPKIGDRVQISEVSNPTMQLTEMPEWARMRLIEKAINDTDVALGPYLLTCVTNGISYDKISAYVDIPCCKDTFYSYYRKFFYILDQRRD